MMLRRWFRVVFFCIAGLTGAALCGCGSRSASQFDRFDLVPPEEELTEFSLGEYKIPIPVVEDRGRNKLEYRTRFQFDFALHALVSPEEKSQFADAWELHEGTIRDRVIRVCRSASVDELQEPELATLKARLMDALATKMGKKELRHLLITEMVSQPL